MQLLGDTVCVTRVASDTALAFDVPIAPGGRQRVIVRQTDGTMSNPATLYVLPVLTGAQPSGRVKTGSLVQLIGSGFAPDARVLVNDGQAAGDIEYLGPNGLRFTLLRPPSVERNASGEPVSVKVVLADGTPSNAITLVLETHRIVVLGDSVAWGQGLAPAQKFANRVASAVSATTRLGVYTDVLAHSGAILGLTPLDTTSLPALTGEVPTSYPTIAQQVALFTDPPSQVSTILVNGGLNDLDIRTVLNPTTSTDEITTRLEQFCHRGICVRCSTDWPRATRSPTLGSSCWVLSDPERPEQLDTAGSLLHGGWIGAGGHSWRDRRWRRHRGHETTYRQKLPDAI